MIALVRKQMHSAQYECPPRTHHHNLTLQEPLRVDSTDEEEDQEHEEDSLDDGADVIEP